MDEEKNNNQGTSGQSDIMDRISLLPDFVYENLFMEKGTEANVEIADKFDLSDEQLKNMLDINLGVVFKEIKIENLSEEIEKRMKLDSVTARQIALELLEKKFYLARSFFPGIEDAILSLGGEIPNEIPKSMGEQLAIREEEIEEIEQQKEIAEQERLADTVITDSIDNLISQFPEAGEMVIGSQKAIAVKNMPVEMKPMIKYWIQDYKEKMGYYRHSNLDRVQYVCHDKNTRNMNEEERRQLNLVLKSSDGEIDLPFSTKRKKIDFSLVKEE